MAKVIAFPTKPAKQKMGKVSFRSSPGAVKITVKQRAARVRNIEVARRAKKAKKGTTGRAQSPRQARSAGKYKSAFAKSYKAERSRGMPKKLARAIAAENATKKAPLIAMKKIGARATHLALKKGYSGPKSEKFAASAKRAARSGRSDAIAMLYARIYAR